MRYLVDADWLIDAAIGRPRAQHLLERLSDDGLAVSIIAVAEVYEGAFGTPDPQATLDGLRAFLGDFAILPVTEPIVEQFARLRATLRRQGQLIPDMALLIAATAITENLTLITRNVRHFARLSDLQLYQPSYPDTDTLPGPTDRCTARGAAGSPPCAQLINCFGSMVRTRHAVWAHTWADIRGSVGSPGSCLIAPRVSPRQTRSRYCATSSHPRNGSACPRPSMTVLAYLPELNTS